MATRTVYFVLIYPLNSIHYPRNDDLVLEARTPFIIMEIHLVVDFGCIERITLTPASSRRQHVQGPICAAMAGRWLGGIAKNTAAIRLELSINDYESIIQLGRPDVHPRANSTARSGSGTKTSFRSLNHCGVDSQRIKSDAT